MKTQVIKTREDCVDVIRTVCTEVRNKSGSSWVLTTDLIQTEEIVDNEVCYYVYNMVKQEAKATTVEVQFDKNCEDETQKVCAKQKYGGYGGHCKQVNNEV